jgi:hypothetical protein
MIEQARRRAKDYWNIDGLPALLRGLRMCCFALFIYWSDHLPYPDVVRGLALGLAMFLDRGAVLFLKNRITYPRTGYVASQPTLRVVVDEPVLLNLSRNDTPLQMPTTGPHVPPLALMVLLVAGVLCLATLASHLGARWVGILLAAAGVYWTLSGTIKLVRYLLRNHLPRA